MCVKWGNSVSTPLGVSNRVCQGGLLSPALFNLYMDELSQQLNECQTGCLIGNILINHLMYADDLAILSPSSAGFQQLLNICSDYGMKYDVQYNAKKKCCCDMRLKGTKSCVFQISICQDKCWESVRKQNTWVTTSQIRCLMMMTYIDSVACYTPKKIPNVL